MTYVPRIRNYEISNLTDEEHRKWVEESVADRIEKGEPLVRYDTPLSGMDVRLEDIDSFDRRRLEDSGNPPKKSTKSL